MSTLFTSAHGGLKAIISPTNGIIDDKVSAYVALTTPNPKSTLDEAALLGACVSGTATNSQMKSAIEHANNPVRVIVVGAGISGLLATAILQRHGVEVTVLEGHPSRIRGSIYTSRQVGKAAHDIGAAWMHETSRNKLVQLIPRLGLEYYYDDGTPLYYIKEGRAGSQFKAKKVADEFAEYCEWYYNGHPDAPDRPVNDFIQDFVGTHPLITADERRWAPQAVREVELWLGTSIEEASSKHLSYFVTERILYLKGGYDQIVDWTARPLRGNPETIRLGEVVKQIEWWWERRLEVFGRYEASFWG